VLATSPVLDTGCVVAQVSYNPTKLKLYIYAPWLVSRTQIIPCV